MCNTHYEAARLRGGLVTRDRDPVKRFWSRVAKVDGCWEWTAAKSTAGYGRMKWGTKIEQAHRIAYELMVGPIPPDRDLDHLCRNRGCVRPDHLEPVTRQVNLLRGETIPAALAERTHCRHGHEFTPENTYLWHGARYCRTCRNGVQEQRVRPEVQRPLVTETCVMCGAEFTFERGIGQTPNVCTERCRQDRKRKAAREYQRRKARASN